MSRFCVKEEESLWVMSLGEQEVKSSFDEKEDDMKDGSVSLE